MERHGTIPTSRRPRVCLGSAPRAGKTPVALRAPCVSPALTIDSSFGVQLTLELKCSINAETSPLTLDGKLTVRRAASAGIVRERYRIHKYSGEYAYAVKRIRFRVCIVQRNDRSVPAAVQGGDQRMGSVRAVPRRAAGRAPSSRRRRAGLRMPCPASTDLSQELSAPSTCGAPARPSIEQVVALPLRHCRCGRRATATASRAGANCVNKC